MGKFDNFLDSITVKVADPRQQTPRIKALFYGMSGTGKTSLAASASKVKELGPVLYIDLERGIAPAAKWGELDNMIVVQPADYTEFLEVLSNLDVGEGAVFNTVVIDTVDRLQELIINYWDKTKPNDGFAKWNASYDKVFELINNIAFHGDMNIICVTHETRQVVESTRLSYIGPAFEGQKSGKKLPSIFDIIGRTTWEEIERNGSTELIQALAVRGESSVLRKTRFDTMPDTVGNPTMQKIMDWVHEHCNTDKEDYD